MHCHVLPGIDDGPATIEDSLALARVAAARGTRTIVATPHVSHRYDNDPATIAALVEQVNDRLEQERVPLNVLAGAEISMTRASELDPPTLDALALGGSGAWLLIEPPFSAEASGIDVLVGELEDEGHRILLAHPERCPAFQRDPQMLESLVRGSGVLTSITAGSLVGRFGGTVKRFALSLIEQELVHNVASDAHDTEQRPPGLAEELREAGLEAMTEWLTEGVPSAILAGEDSLPPRPMLGFSSAREQRGSWWRRGPLRRAS
ncbi:MAG TPA: CpsB/CapC family capsule biosynthesis tyrosine phosphatase [Solirubrobacteraceae bacterium]|nr:CpsB/CapC family capsule biosynthesis tyrosine phosphatase [Solirubrobacteraceae bacterium]